MSTNRWPGGKKQCQSCYNSIPGFASVCEHCHSSQVDENYNPNGSLSDKVIGSIVICVILYFWIF